MKNQYIIIAVITLVFISFAFPSSAQLQAPQISLPRVPSVFDNPPSLPAAPIDGGLSLLIAAGAGYGMKKLKERKNKQENNK